MRITLNLLGALGAVALLVLPSLVKAQENPLQVVILFGQSNANRPGLDRSMQQRADQLSGNSIHVHKVAEGGLSLAQVDGARDWSPYSDNEAYDAFLLDINSTMKKLQDSGWTPLISAGFWVQGEGDALILGRANDYNLNLAHFIDSVWQDLGTEFPIWVSELSNQQNPFASVVRAAQVNQARSRHNVHLLETQDLTFLSDGVHYTPEAQHLLGRRVISALADNGHITSQGLK